MYLNKNHHLEIFLKKKKSSMEKYKNIVSLFDRNILFLNMSVNGLEIQPISSYHAAIT